MARSVIAVTLGQALPNGYNSVAAGKGDKSATLDTAQAAAVAACAAVTANVTVAGDPTALGLAQAADTAAAAVGSAITVMKTGDMVVSIDTSVIGTRNKFEAAVQALRQALYGSMAS